MAWLADDCTTGQIQWHKHTFDGIEGHRGENLSHTTDGASSDVLECLELVRHHLLANSWLCHPARCPRTRSDKLRRNKSCAEQSGCVEGTRVTRSVRHATPLHRHRILLDRSLRVTHLRNNSHVPFPLHFPLHFLRRVPHEDPPGSQHNTLRASINHDVLSGRCHATIVSCRRACRRRACGPGVTAPC